MIANILQEIKTQCEKTKSQKASKFFTCHKSKILSEWLFEIAFFSEGCLTTAFCDFFLNINISNKSLRIIAKIPT